VPYLGAVAPQRSGSETESYSEYSELVDDDYY